MAKIDSVTETRSVTKDTIVWRATIEFKDDGTIKEVIMHGKRVILDGETTTEKTLPHKVAVPNPADLELTARITRLDNSIEWLWKNTPNYV